jgi:hypothetical protein
VTRDRNRYDNRLETVGNKLLGPTLKLLEIDSLYIATSQVLYVSDESVCILLGVFWEPRYEVLEVRIAPRVTG